MLHTKYQGSCFFLFQTIFYFAQLPYINLCKTCEPRGGTIFGPQEQNLNKLCRGRESKPHNSDFYQKDFFQRGNTKRMAHILSNYRSSRPIKTPLKSINLASKCRIYENFHYLVAHFTKIRGFALKKMLKIS